MKWFLVLAFIISAHFSSAQVVEADTVIPARERTVELASTEYADSLRHRRIRKTILRSTFIPGWGQVTNKQVWKVPVVAAAVSIPVFVFFYNVSEYRSLRQAYIYKVDNDPSNDPLIPERFQPLSANSIKYYRDSYRQNVDYSALAFLLAWGLNVVDAAVFANLKDFDVSDKLSLRLKPDINSTGQAGVGLVLTFKNSKKQAFFN